MEMAVTIIIVAFIAYGIGQSRGTRDERDLQWRKDQDRQLERERAVHDWETAVHHEAKRRDAVFEGTYGVATRKERDAEQAAHLRQVTKYEAPIAGRIEEL